MTDGSLLSQRGFEATVFIDSIRQTVEIIDMDREITTGQKTKVFMLFNVVKMPGFKNNRIAR